MTQQTMGNGRPMGLNQAKLNESEHAILIGWRPIAITFSTPLATELTWPDDGTTPFCDLKDTGGAATACPALVA